MEENHSHPAIRNRNIVVKPAVPTIPPTHPDPPPIIIPPPIESPPAVEPEKPKPRPKKPQDKRIPLPDVLPLITCIITNFKTRNLTKIAVSSLLHYYPNVSIILTDNGSKDSSTTLVKTLGAAHDNITSVLHEANIGHGPAMNKAIWLIDTPFFFTLDSDCEVIKGGFLERMLKHFQSNYNLYAIGWLRHVDPKSGVSVGREAKVRPKHLPYIHPYAAMFRTIKYFQLSPFNHHGAPCTANMRDARDAGFSLQSFPIDNYIKHLKAGTRRLYKGHWDPKPTDKPGPWTEDREWPI